MRRVRTAPSAQEGGHPFPQHLHVHPHVHTSVRTLPHVADVRKALRWRWRSAPHAARRGLAVSEGRADNVR